MSEDEQFEYQYSYDDLYYCSIDRTAQILMEIANQIDKDGINISQDARRALSDVNAAIARQDRRLGNGK
jgi:hypothetical protein